MDLQKNYLATGKIATVNAEKTGKTTVDGVKVNKGGAEFLKMRPDLMLEEFPVTIFEQSGLFEVGDGSAVERIAAISKAGFTKSDHLLVGKQGYAYDGYWELLR